MIHFYYGPNAYTLQQEITAIKTNFLKREEDINLQIIDGSELESVHQFVGIAQAVPFLWEKRLVIIKNLIRNNKRKTVFLKEIADYLERKSLEEGNELYFIENTEEAKAPMGNLKITKLLLNKNKKTANFVKNKLFNLLSSLQLKNWVKDFCWQEGCQLEEKAVVHLLFLCEGDQYKLANELIKLTSFKPQGTVSKIEIEEMVKPVGGYDVFKFTNYLFDKKKELAFRELNLIWENNENEMAILGLLISNFKTLILIKEASSQTLNNVTIAQNLKLHPYRVKMLLPTVQKVSMLFLKSFFQHLVQIEIGIKTGQVKDKKLAISQLVVEF